MLLQPFTQVQKGPADFAPTSVPHPFDVQHGTDTSGWIPGEALPSGSPADLYNTAYWAISPSTLRQALARLPLEPAGYTFVDLGCGKGRALLLAAEFGFGRVTGVELSPQLATIARANTVSHNNIDIEQGDAATFVYPPGPLLVFFYHPFLAPLQTRVLANLERQLRASPRPCYVLNANPGYPRVYARFQYLELVWNDLLALLPEDAAHDRHGVTREPYSLFRSTLG